MEKAFSDQIMNSIPGIFYVFDDSGKFIRWNTNFARISEYSDEEIAQPVDAPLTDDDLVDLAAVAPISLPPPATPRAEETDAGKIEEEVSAQETKRKFCFIATAAYGSPMAREVLLLKTFRDDHLAPRFCGRKFIQGYYRVSPFLARPIGRSNLLKLLTRWLLTPIVCFIKKNFGGPGRS